MPKEECTSHKTLLELTLHFAPRTKKNHGRIVRPSRTGRPIMLPSKSYVEYEQRVIEATAGMGFVTRPRLTGPNSGKLAQRIFEAQTAKLPDRLKPIAVPVNVMARYCMDANRRVDIVGLHQALHDALTAAGVLMDDSAINPAIVVATDGSTVEVDRDNPRTEVVITRI